MDSPNKDHAFTSGKRQNPRIDFPASVIIHHTEIGVLDWSLGGFAIADNLIEEAQHKEIPIRFLFPITHGHLALELACQVVRISTGGYAVGFQFVHIPNAVKKTLNDILTSYLAGERVNLNESVKTGIRGKLFEYEQVRLASNWGRFVLVSTLLIAVIGFAGWLLYKNIFDIQSEYAAVSENIIEIPAIRTGELTNMTLTKGAHLHKGQPMFSILSEQQQQKLGNMQSELETLNIEIRHMDNRYQNGKLLLSFYQDRLQVEQTSTAEKIKTIQNEIAIQQKQYQLLTSKKNYQAIDDLTKDKTLIELYNKKRTLEDLKEKLNLNKNYQSVAKQGMFAEDDVSKMFSLHDMQDTLEYKKNQEMILKQDIKRLKDHATYHSPCDCSVAEINAAPGPVTINKTLVKLSAQPAVRRVLALVPLNHANYIFSGATAHFQVASSDQVLSGKVVKVGYYNASDPNVYDSNGELFSGLPKILPRMGQYTLVTILPDTPLKATAFNEPAVVNIKIGLWEFMKRGVLL